MLVSYWYITGRGKVELPPIVPAGLEGDCNDWIYSCSSTVCPQRALTCDMHPHILVSLFIDASSCHS